MPRKNLCGILISKAVTESGGEAILSEAYHAGMVQAVNSRNRIREQKQK